MSYDEKIVGLEDENVIQADPVHQLCNRRMKPGNGQTGEHCKRNASNMLHILTSSLWYQTLYLSLYQLFFCAESIRNFSFQPIKP